MDIIKKSWWGLLLITWPLLAASSIPLPESDFHSLPSFESPDFSTSFNALAKSPASIPFRSTYSEFTVDTQTTWMDSTIFQTHLTKPLKTVILGARFFSHTNPGIPLTSRTSNERPTLDGSAQEKLTIIELSSIQPLSNQWAFGLHARRMTHQFLSHKGLGDSGDISVHYKWSPTVWTSMRTLHLISSPIKWSSGYREPTPSRLIVEQGVTVGDWSAVFSGNHRQYRYSLHWFPHSLFTTGIDCVSSQGRIQRYGAGAIVKMGKFAVQYRLLLFIDDTLSNQTSSSLSLGLQL